MVRQEGCNAQALGIRLLVAVVDYSASSLYADGPCVVNLSLVASKQGVVKQRGARADAQVDLS